MDYSLGDKIRVLRAMKGYSQKGLAKTIGLRQENISYIEQNKMKKELNHDILERIAAALDIKVEDIHSFQHAKLPETRFPIKDDTEICFERLNKIILLQKQTIETLYQLNEMYINRR